MSIRDKVKPNRSGKELNGSRSQGICRATVYQIEEALGERHSPGDGYKTSAEWFLETPAGRVTIRNSHVLPDDQMLVCSECEQAAMYGIEYMTAHGIDGDLLTRGAA